MLRFLPKEEVRIKPSQGWRYFCMSEKVKGKEETLWMILG